MNEAPTTIRRSDKATRNAGFERLLAMGLKHVQQISGKRWTDHNLHDPGITVLEQLCFALTELAYHADFPVADHLAGADGRIAFTSLALHAPEHALSCRATTAADYRRRLVDRVDGLNDAHLQPAPAGPTGVYRMHVKVASATRATREQLVAQALQAYREERNLGEDVEPHVVIVRDKTCQLHADIEISGPRDAAEVMAEVYHRASRWIDRSPRLLTRREALARHGTPDRIYDGPVIENGFIDEEQQDQHRGQSLYLADLARALTEVPGIKEIHALALQTPDGRVHSGSLVWSQADWALRLHLPGEAGEMLVKLHRRRLDVKVAAPELSRRVRNLQAADRSARYRLASNLRAEEEAALPRGKPRMPARYLSVQHHFPVIYGLGRNGLPASAAPQQKARLRQMRSYLLMFEQILAGGEEQVQHLRELYSVAEGGHRSYWWPVFKDPDRDAAAPGIDERGLDDRRGEIPGLSQVLVRPHAQIAQHLREHFDRSSVRKSRLLDHLLALHGETFTQNALRQYCAHLRSDELDRLLMDNKAHYLGNIVELSRHRAGAFDYSRALWDNPGNFSGLARRVCLLLGFRHDHARSLTRALQEARLPVVEAGEEVPGQIDAAAAQAGEAINVVDAAHGANGADASGSMAMLAQRGPRLLAPLLRAGASHDGYRLLSQRSPASSTAASISVVAVGPDERQRWWRLGHAASNEAARRAALNFRRAYLEVNDACEGLHLVEHVLLRPLHADSRAHAALNLDADFYALRLSVLMPDWTVRTHQGAFRQLAEETLRINVPSHLDLQVQWLGYEQMEGFERDFERWLTLRQQWCGQATPALERGVDEAACQVSRWLAPIRPRDAHESGGALERAWSART